MRSLWNRITASTCSACQQYPWSLKQRIMSRHGHLSNEDLYDWLPKDFDGSARYLVLAHLLAACERTTPRTHHGRNRSARTCAALSARHPDHDLQITKNRPIDLLRKFHSFSPTTPRSMQQGQPTAWPIMLFNIDPTGPLNMPQDLPPLAESGITTHCIT